MLTTYVRAADEAAAQVAADTEDRLLLPSMFPPISSPVGEPVRDAEFGGGEGEDKQMCCGAQLQHCMRVLPTCGTGFGGFFVAAIRKLRLQEGAPVEGQYVKYKV